MSEDNGGVVKGATKIGNTLALGIGSNASCTAAIILAGIFAVLTYIALQREAERSQARLLKATELIESCIAEKAGKEDRQ